MLERNEKEERSLFFMSKREDDQVRLQLHFTCSLCECLECYMQTKTSETRKTVATRIESVSGALNNF